MPKRDSRSAHSSPVYEDYYVDHHSQSDRFKRNQKIPREFFLIS